MKKLLLIALLIMGCDKDPTASTDCAGIVNGVAAEDDCGVCAGGTTGVLANADKDCAGECGGDAEETYGEDCAGCGSGIFDCAFICDGSAIVDCAGECGGSAVLSDCDNTTGDGNGNENNTGQTIIGVWEDPSPSFAEGVTTLSINDDGTYTGVWIGAGEDEGQSDGDYGTYDLSNNQIIFHSNDCGGDGGTYTYTINNNELTFSLVDDECAGLVETIVGTWYLVE